MIDRNIKQFVLKALYAAKDQPINGDTLRQLVRTAFSHVALTEDQLGGWIGELEAAGLITKADDAVFGIMWSLTLKGITNAQRLQ